MFCRFDQDFNPQNDLQAQDRVYRIGQQRDVLVVKLISGQTIEQEMLERNGIKILLNRAVTGGELNQTTLGFHDVSTCVAQALLTSSQLFQKN